MDIQIILKLFLSFALGGIIGIEQEISHKRGALKANVLIAIGSTMMTMLAFQLQTALKTPGIEIFTIIAHIISSLGLMGAAIIIRERFFTQGLTTAAIAWSVGVIGILVGCGFYLSAFLSTIVIFIGLTLLKLICQSLEKQSTIYTYIITTEERASILMEIKKIVLELGLNYINASIKKNRGGYQIELVLTTSMVKNKSFVERVMQLPDVIEINSEHL